MSIDKITKQHVLDAVDKIEREGIVLEPSTRFDVVINGKSYPPKEVMRYANLIANGTKDWPYSGGEPTNKYLRKFQFEIVPKGEESLSDLLKTHKECLYITKLEGASGCSAVSGDISIGAQGFLYRDGERIKPVDKITLNSNYFDLIFKIQKFSNEYLDSYTSFKVPDLLVEEVHVAG